MMRRRKKQNLVAAFLMAALLFFVISGCSFAQADMDNGKPLASGSGGVYEDRQRSASSAEEGGAHEEGMESSGTAGEPNEADTIRDTQFRNTAKGEPLAMHLFINRVLVDDEWAKITLQSKTADELGDAGFTLKVENRYEPLTLVGYDNYCYITPIMGTWTVNGVKMDPKAEGKVYPGEPATIYLYFDDLSSIDQLVSIKGEFELYCISDWWNPVGVYEFDQA